MFLLHLNIYIPISIFWIFASTYKIWAVNLEKKIHNTLNLFKTEISRPDEPYFHKDVIVIENVNTSDMIKLQLIKL